MANLTDLKDNNLESEIVTTMKNATSRELDLFRHQTISRGGQRFYPTIKVDFKQIEQQYETIEAKKNDPFNLEYKPKVKFKTIRRRN